MLSTWVFDVDDTLYLEREYVRSGFEAVGLHLNETRGITGFASCCWESFKGGNRFDTFNKSLAALGIEPTPQLIEELVHSYRQHEPAISLDSSTHHLLTELKANQKVAILTGGNPISQERKVRALKLDQLAGVIVYAGMHGPEMDKPHPWSWREVERLTNAQANDLVYIGDNPRKDFKVALELNWIAVRVRLKNSEHYNIPTPDGVCEVSTLAEAVGLLS